jgi:hypothetical protein
VGFATGRRSGGRPMSRATVNWAGTAATTDDEPGAGSRRGWQVTTRDQVADGTVDIRCRGRPDRGLSGHGRGSRDGGHRGRAGPPLSGRHRRRDVHGRLPSALAARPTWPTGGASSTSGCSWMGDRPDRRQPQRQGADVQPDALQGRPRSC